MSIGVEVQPLVLYIHTVEVGVNGIAWGMWVCRSVWMMWLCWCLVGVGIYV